MNKAFRNIAAVCLFLSLTCFCPPGTFAAGDIGGGVSGNAASKNVTAQSCYKAVQEQQKLKNWY